MAEQSEGRLADQDFARLGRLFETSRQVNRASGNVGLVTVHGSRDDLAGVHPGAHANRDSPASLELLVESPKRARHVGSSPRRAQRVVFVGVRNPEHGDDGVADEFLGRASVALHDLLHGFEISNHQLAVQLGVQLFAQPGRAGDIAKEHGNDLPSGRRRRVGHGRTEQKTTAAIWTKCRAPLTRLQPLRTVKSTELGDSLLRGGDDGCEELGYKQTW